MKVERKKKKQSKKIVAVKSKCPVEMERLYKKKERARKKKERELKKKLNMAEESQAGMKQKRKATPKRKNRRKSPKRRVVKRKKVQRKKRQNKKK